MRSAGQRRLAAERLAAIDVGSSAARITIAERGARGSPGPLRVLWQHRYPVRLGQYAFAAGDTAIAPPCEAELVAAAHAMRAQLAAYRVTRSRAVATCALREASNGQLVADRMGLALGVPVDIVSGAAEAALARRALREALQQGNRPLPSQALLLDIGGGSTELTTLTGPLSASLPLGTVRLLQAEPALLAPLEAAQIEVVAGKVAQTIALALAQSPFQNGRQQLGGRLVGSGGNLPALARAAPAQARGAQAAAGGGSRIAVAGLRALQVPVAAMALPDRAAAYHLPKERADLFLPALLLAHGLAVAFAADEIWVPGTGLREALLAELADAADTADAADNRTEPA